MDIKRITNNNKTNFTGKIIYKNDISNESKKLLQNFLASKKDGKTNFEMIKNKSNDLFVSENHGHLTLTTNYRQFYLDEPKEYYLVGLKPDTTSENFKWETSFFRNGLEGFQEHKKNFNGYNNLFEKIIAVIKEYC